MSYRHKIAVILFLGVLAGVILLFIYSSYNPEHFHYFPQCPVKLITGYDCTGCGSQRAVHDYLHLRWIEGFKHNPLLPFLFLYAVAGMMINRVSSPSVLLLQWRKILYGTTAIYIVLMIIIAFTIARNL